MRKAGKTVLRSLIFLVLLVVFMAGLSLLFHPKNNREDFGMGEMKANGILAEPENTIDVVAVGDSECALAVSPMVMWREQGIASYNCGTAGQYLYEAYDYLLQALKKQQVNVVLLETNMIFRECSLSDWLFSKMERLLPVFRYHDRWKSMRAEDLGPVDYTWKDDYKGQMFYTEAEPAQEGEYMIPTDAVRGIPKWNRLCLEEIVRLCRKKGISLILFSAPSTVNWNYESHNAVQAFADKHDLTYVDMNLLREEVPIDWRTETKDAGDHVNCRGAEKVSSYLGRFLAENYSLTDHRKEAAYAVWEEALAVYGRAWKEMAESGT